MKKKTDDLKISVPFEFFDLGKTAFLLEWEWLFCLGKIHLKTKHCFERHSLNESVLDKGKLNSSTKQSGRNVHFWQLDKQGFGVLVVRGDLSKIAASKVLKGRMIKD